VIIVVAMITDRYGYVVRQLAGQYQPILLDTQTAFDYVLTEVNPTILALDWVHNPYPCFLKGVGVSLVNSGIIPISYRILKGAYYLASGIIPHSLWLLDSSTSASISQSSFSASLTTTSKFQS
jgi:hypothetical protein